MSKYYIPEVNLKKLEALVKKLSKKTEVKFSYDKNDIKQECFEDEVKDIKLHYITVGVELDIDYKVGDYELVAEIEHIEGTGNIIRHINLNYEVPEYYRNCDLCCDHCHTHRDRKYTFLLVDKNGNYKLVGKGCLKEYTGITDLALVNLVSSLSTLLGKEYLEDEEFLRLISADSYFNLKDTANIFYQIIVNYGYDKYNSLNYFDKFTYSKDAEKDVEEILNVVNTDWYNDSEYCHNIKVLLSMNNIKNTHFGFLLSYINSAIKYLQSKNIKNEYLGKEGDKIQFQVKTFKVLFTNYNKYSYYNESVIYTYRIVTTSGQIVLWKTEHILENGEVVKATIKSLNEYKGEKQTVVTRGSIVVEETQPKIVEPQCTKELNEFIKYLNTKEE